uniref:AlNc14C11G1339 protein n=1 Tax=Albugo laibachii Nc14 TaxID=890382 RepID=F0W2W1_9STRA|nr:AlNc14C11G1339 [Albugo laibachii Nc14]|eukprot:CCA15397.1 AlNc14C11G1339 [Albugo laibachii Nc14]
MSDSMQRDATILTEGINQVENVELKKHMLSALESFQSAKSKSPSTRDTTQTYEDKDHILRFVAENSSEIRRTKDALVVAIHLLILEAGFSPKVPFENCKLPKGWDTHSADNLFQISYRGDEEDSCYDLKVICVGDKLEVYFCDSSKRVHSLEVSASDYLDEASTESPLHNITSLRAKMKGFLENIQESGAEPKVSAGPHPTARNERDEYGRGNRSAPIPPVGSGDVFMPSLIGGDPGMLVGPNHEIFRRRHDSSRDMVPGARFDPFGPVTGPGIPSRDGNLPFPGAPRLPFGDPNPDHLRMPRDDEHDDFGSYGQPMRDVNRPFGSDFSYF